MRFAIELYLDSPTADRIIQVWQELEQAGLATAQTAKRPYTPHISLAVAPELDQDWFSRLVEDFAADYQPVPLLFTHLGIFRAERNVLFVAPQASEQLVRMHKAFFALVAGEQVDWWHYYRPDRWVPHCTLTTSDSFGGIARALLRCEALPFPFVAWAERVALVDFVEGEELCLATLGALENAR
jgi:2'-5' RNA ligase